MCQNNNLEIYRQRYETFRHLDKLRWQMLQIVAAIGSVSALSLRVMKAEAEWWFIGIIGIILLFFSYAMFRIGEGIMKNGIVLQNFGEKVGDTTIPDVSGRWRASSHWIAILVFVIGILCLSFATLKMIGQFCGDMNA